MGNIVYGDAIGYAFIREYADDRFLKIVLIFSHLAHVLLAGLSW